MEMWIRLTERSRNIFLTFLSFCARAQNRSNRIQLCSGRGAIQTLRLEGAQLDPLAETECAPGQGAHFTNAELVHNGHWTMSIRHRTPV